MNSSGSKKRLLALQESKFLSIEIQDAIRFGIEKLSDAGDHDAQIPELVMANNSRATLPRTSTRAWPNR
jgi:hypothetical protein